MATKLYTPESTPIQADGWIAPNGDLYACGTYGHRNCAYELEGCDVWDLEEKGYLHISEDEIRNTDTKPTNDQLGTLLEMAMLNTESPLAYRIKSYVEKWENYI